jgi:hypothetical protein
LNCLPSNADINCGGSHVRFVPIATERSAANRIVIRSLRRLAEAFP